MAQYRTELQIPLIFTRKNSIMDDFDKALLAAVQDNNRQTAEQLSTQVGLSPDACRKRLAKLRQSGMIEAEVAVLNPEKLGRGLTLVVEVTLRSERPGEIDAFQTKMLDAPEVMQCYYVTGEADFVLTLTTRDMADYEAFSRKYFFADDNVARFRTNVVMKRVKSGLTVPLD